MPQIGQGAGISGSKPTATEKPGHTLSSGDLVGPLSIHQIAGWPASGSKDFQTDQRGELKSSRGLGFSIRSKDNRVMHKWIMMPRACRADIPEEDSRRNDHTHQLTLDVAYRRLAIVNVVFVGHTTSGSTSWVLVDAGLPGSATLIANAANARFPRGARPSAIVLTHAHFDHVGALKKLASDWDVPVYAHPLEMPFLDGSAAYPEPDARVGGGLMSMLAPLYPRGPVNVRERLHPLPQDGSVPGMPGWRWIHTPGHVSFWRERDRTLIVGDAFVTTAQESAYSVAIQRPAMHGPPMYCTQNWAEAEKSVITLASLNPEVAVTGHGLALRGTQLRAALRELALNFRLLAVPDGGRYVDHPATVELGTAYVRS
jgi:glyoxylase-like metal-dependent hydrolase (beta-lactamase superfamily II)